MNELFPKPDRNPWQTLADVTGESNTSRLDRFVYVFDAITTLLYRGQAKKRVDFGDPKTMKRLSYLFNQEFSGEVKISLDVILGFISVHGDPDGYEGGVIGACTGITDRIDPGKAELAAARRILDKL